MNAVLETLAGIETFSELAGRESLPAAVRNLAVSPMVARLPLRQARQTWHSTLCEKDLLCLLQVLEADLIPRLLTGYSPAVHAAGLHPTGD